MPTPIKSSPPPAPKPPDPVDEAAVESFPASDPPAWEPLHPGPPGNHPDRREGTTSKGREPL